MGRLRYWMVFALVFSTLLSGCAPEVVPTPPAPEGSTEQAPVAEPTVTVEVSSPQAPTPSPVASLPPLTPITATEAHVNHDQVLATNDMGLELLRQLGTAADPGTNLFISPVSVALALGMVANGASGETHAGILKAMHLEGWSEEAANQALAGLTQSLTSGDLGVELDVANSLWLREGLPFRRTFLETVQAYYGAQVSALDFAAPDAAETINAWVAAQTHERIQEIITPPIDANAILFLINAVYFKGDWQTPFDEALTEEQSFVRADGRAVQAPFMSRFGSFRYVDGGAYQAVRLPYAGDRLSMIVVLPARGTELDAWVAELDATAWAALAASLAEADGTVALPRFTLAFESRLNDALARMGMADALDPTVARFDRIHELQQPTWIDEVRHKTFVEVNEQGTEAAAVTSVEVQALAAAPQEPFSFVADHPFLFGIQDDQTGALLFAGIMRDPLQAEAAVP